MEIQQVMVISTAHISPDFADGLNHSDLPVFDWE